MIKHSLAIFQILFFFIQEPPVFSMQQDISVSNMIIPREDIFIHTDREIYIAGENLWYAAYLFDRKNENRPGKSRIAYIELLSSDNNPVVQKRISLENGSGNGFFVIPDTLSSGSFMLRAYTNWMKNFPPDECFYKRIDIYNPFKNSKFNKVLMPANNLKSDVSRHIISVRSPDACKQREKITLDITIDGSVVSSPENTGLSISVSAIADSVEFMSIHDYVLSRSVEGEWSVSGSEMNDFSNKTEEEGYYMKGRLISHNPDVTLKDQLVFLSVPGKEAVFQYAVTDDNGDFSFMLPITRSRTDLVIQQAGYKSNNLIRIESSFWDKYTEFEKHEDTSDFQLPANISEWSENHQVARIYGTTSAVEQVYQENEQKKQSGFYGIPDMELIMADYILLPVMQEVFFELIPGVSMRTGKTRYGITVSNPFNNRPYNADATLMVDGVIIDDPAIIIEMNPEIVERIDIVRTEYVIGGYHFYGIVNVITKSGNFNSLPLPENAVRFQHSMFGPEIPFVSPDYSTTEMKNSRIPDFRNTLYWNPSVEPDEDGKARVEFWASDYISDYVISVQGMTTDGQVISFKKILKVE